MPERLAAALVFAVCCYRAATQSLVIDEAYMWANVIQPESWNAVFTWPNTNNHFLFSLFSRACADLVGDSEFALRLPTLAGTLLFLTALVRLGQRFRHPALFVLFCAGNPLVLDHLVAARGYGLGLGFLFTALELQTRRKWTGAALAASAAVMSNLTFAAPAVVLALMVERAGWKYFYPAVAACAAVFYFVSPLRHMELGGFTVGEARLWLSAETLWHSSLANTDGLLHLNRPTVLHVEASRLLGWVIGPLSWIVAWKSPYARLAAGSWLVLIALHYAMGMPYPFERTGIYLLPLCAAVFFQLADELPRWSFLVGALGIMFLIQFETRSFARWRFDADTPNLLASLHPEARPMRVGVSWNLSFSSRYYQDRLGWDKLTLLPNDKQPPGLDYYLLLPEEEAKLKDLNVTVVARGPVSGAILAASR